MIHVFGSFLLRNRIKADEDMVNGLFVLLMHTRINGGQPWILSD